MNLRERLLQHAWYLGQELTVIKEEIGHEKWLQFLEGQWREMSVRSAQRYMLFFKENPNARNSTHLTFTTESIQVHVGLHTREGAAAARG